MMASRFPLLVVIAALVLLAATHSLFSSSPFVVAAQAGAVVLLVWARRSFPKGTFRVEAAPGGQSVLRRGPYRFVRHPMYSGALLFLWAGIVSHLSIWNVVIGLAVTLSAVGRIVAEERLLRSRYPEYDAYARSTKALIPFIA
jgi:protein-S-isoprenylcysteine O-methyltransferase Ste14